MNAWYFDIYYGKFVAAFWFTVGTDARWYIAVMLEAMWLQKRDKEGFFSTVFIRYFSFTEYNTLVYISICRLLTTVHFSHFSQNRGFVNLTSLIRHCNTQTTNLLRQLTGSHWRWTQIEKLSIYALFEHCESSQKWLDYAGMFKERLK